MAIYYKLNNISTTASSTDCRIHKQYFIAKSAAIQASHICNKSILNPLPYREEPEALKILHNSLRKQLIVGAVYERQATLHTNFKFTFDSSAIRSSHTNPI